MEIVEIMEIVLVFGNSLYSELKTLFYFVKFLQSYDQ
jgi:hypothetical protein